MAEATKVIQRAFGLDSGRPRQLIQDRSSMATLISNEVPGKEKLGPGVHLAQVGHWRGEIGGLAEFQNQIRAGVAAGRRIPPVTKAQRFFAMYRRFL
jgi:hypothetical protein